MDRAAIKTTIEKAYEARRTDDVEGIMAAFHQDGTFELAGSKELTAVAGIVRGHPDLRTTFASLIANFQFLQRDIVSVLIDDDRAAVHSRVKLRFIPKNA